MKVGSQTDTTILTVASPFSNGGPPGSAQKGKVFGCGVPSQTIALSVKPCPTAIYCLDTACLSSATSSAIVASIGAQVISTGTRASVGSTRTPSARP